MTKKLGLSKFRNVSVSDVFNYVEVDDLKVYTIKEELLRADKWYYDRILEKLYKYNSINLHMRFKTNDIPKRCVNKIRCLTEDLYSYLKSRLKRVSKSKCKLIVIHFVKHISRLVYHKDFCITYTRKKSNWSSNNTLSCEYMIHLVDYLSSEGYLYNYLGNTKASGENVLSLLVVTPSFIRDCINHEESPKAMEECLKRFNDSSVIIRDKDKKIIDLEGDELVMVNTLKVLNDKYNEELSKTLIYINGKPVPELFFRRIGTEAVDYGMRNYDDGSIQGEDAISRESVTIDGEHTVELDYSSLHYSLAAEQEGIKLNYHQDPYNFDIDIEVDWVKVEKWKNESGWDREYDPVRNLKKAALLIMFNADSEESAKKAITQAIFKDSKKLELIKKKFIGINKVPADKLIKAIIDNNQIVSKYFLSGIGLEFQRKDSDMIMYCINKFLEIGEVCIPVHDSIIVKESLKEFGKQCMCDAYKHVMGSNFNCRVK